MIGQTLGHYRIVEKIGAGGMGEVYRARDEHLGRDVAIKVLIEHAQPLVAKLKCLTSLTHPNIAAFLGLEELANSRCLIMEFVPGKTLAERLELGSLPVEDTIGICLQVAQAHEAVHKKGIFHGGLSPGKVKVTRDGIVKVLHFGFAKAIELDAEYVIDLVEPLDFWTVQYMAPEVIGPGCVSGKADSADARSDLWSLGVLLYEMTTAERPFKGQNLRKVMEAILHQPPAPLPPDVPEELREIIEHCLEKEPAQRYQRASEVRAALEAI